MERWVYEVVALALQAIGIVAFVVWKLGDIRTQITIEILQNRSTSGTALAEHQAADNKEFATIRSEALQHLSRIQGMISDGNATLRHDVGESLAAIRQKIADSDLTQAQKELWNRDHFLQKDSFHKAHEALEEDVKERLEDLKRVVDRIETKIIDNPKER